MWTACTLQSPGHSLSEDSRNRCGEPDSRPHPQMAAMFTKWLPLTSHQPWCRVGKESLTQQLKLLSFWSSYLSFQCGPTFAAFPHHLMKQKSECLDSTGPEILPLENSPQKCILGLRGVCFKLIFGSTEPFQALASCLKREVWLLQILCCPLAESDLRFTEHPGEELSVVIYLRMESVNSTWKSPRENSSWLINS